MSNPEYAWALKIIQDARAGRVSEKRAKALLEKYGGEQYRVTTSFEVAVTHSNGPTFKAAIEKFRAENEGDGKEFEGEFEPIESTWVGVDDEYINTVLDAFSEIETKTRVNGNP